MKELPFLKKSLIIIFIFNVLWDMLINRFNKPGILNKSFIS